MLAATLNRSTELGDPPSTIEAGVSTSSSVAEYEAELEPPLPAYLPPVLFPTVEPTLAPPTPSVVEAASARVAAQGGTLSESEMRHVLEAAGWPTELHSQALAVAWCESRFSIDGKGDISNHPEQMGVPMSRGLFQMGAAGYRWINGSWQWWNGWFRYFGYSDDDAYDPVTNATVARRAYEQSGWGPWSCRSAVY